MNILQCFILTGNYTILKNEIAKQLECFSKNFRGVSGAFSPTSTIMFNSLYFLSA